jgi:hypothetical protein
LDVDLSKLFFPIRTPFKLFTVRLIIVLEK